MNWQNDIYHRIDYDGLTPWEPIGYLIKGALYKTQLFLWHAKNRKNQHFYIVAKPTGTLDDDSYMYFLRRDNDKEYCDGGKVPVYNFGHTTLVKFVKAKDKLNLPPNKTQNQIPYDDFNPNGSRHYEPLNLLPKTKSLQCCNNNNKKELVHDRSMSAYHQSTYGWYRPLKGEPKYDLRLETARTKYDLRNSQTYPVAFTDFER